MRPLSRPPSRPSRLAAVALAGTLALGLAACSAGDDSGASVGGAADLATQSDGAVREEAAGAPAPGAVAPDKAQSTTTVISAITDRKLARRADVSLRVEDVTAAASRLRAIASAAGGLVVAEEVSSDPDEGPVPLGGAVTSPSGWGSVTISVPVERLDATLDEVAEVGTVLSRRTGTSDVTGQYVDTASRVESLKASVERVRALMSRATKLADIVTLESELSRRQADLESMQQQLAALEDRVALAPISVTLSTTGETPPTTEDPTGFLAGLAAGWAAFTTSVRLLLTLLGALLPFAVATAAVVVPLVVWWRRRTRPVMAATPPSAPTA
ncbi:DUF4349 domain-containing protein [uncultured Phycicoccus sp.]|uniref:DUF4349 domain-containing protein n=1 Tax=uncultured Phycicoccus sp. TaxID=661422 RepID=UPI00262F02DA|nr:DUF4349 domain-containing protein [uncultured Phycicoccus sp.]